MYDLWARRSSHRCKVPRSALSDAPGSALASAAIALERSRLRKRALAPLDCKAADNHRNEVIDPAFPLSRERLGPSVFSVEAASVLLFPSRRSCATAFAFARHPARSTRCLGRSKPAHPASRRSPTATSLTDPPRLRHRRQGRTNTTLTSLHTTMPMQQKRNGRCGTGAATRQPCLGSLESTLLTPPTTSTRPVNLTVLPTTARRLRGEGALER